MSDGIRLERCFRDKVLESVNTMQKEKREKKQLTQSFFVKKTQNQTPVPTLFKAEVAKPLSHACQTLDFNFIY